MLVFVMGLFGAMIATGIFSALAELSYLIFKYPKDWNGLEYKEAPNEEVEEQENNEEPLSQN
jgi:hypothetical protein